MSHKVLEKLKQKFGAKILEATSFRGDEVAVVEASDWLAVAAYLRDDADLAMDHFIDLTAVDYPEREPEGPRFDVVLLLRSMSKNHRIRIKTRVSDSVASLVPLWPAANWAERECFDMFGIKFAGHPDLRRILMYDEFVGYPLRKDYPIERTQPLVPYRDTGGLEKLAPFGESEGQPWGRIDWKERLAGRGLQVSPAIALQTGQRRTLSQSEAVTPTQQKAPPTSGTE